MRKRRTLNREYFKFCIRLAQKNSRWSIEEVEAEANKTFTASVIDWQHYEGDKYTRTVEINGRYFWADAIRYGQRQRFIAGWRVSELKSPGGFLLREVATDLRWHEVDRAVDKYLQGGANES